MKKKGMQNWNKKFQYFRMQPIKYKELNSEITIRLFPGNGHSTSMTV